MPKGNLKEGEQGRLGRDLLRSNSCFATPRALFGIEISPREGHFIFLAVFFWVVILFFGVSSGLGD